MKSKKQLHLPDNLWQKPNESVDEYLDRCYESAGFVRPDGTPPYSGLSHGLEPEAKIACGDCQHIIRNFINPETGLAECTTDVGSFYPMQPHFCDHYQERENNEN
jgi:hypothetical protein